MFSAASAGAAAAAQQQPPPLGWSPHSGAGAMTQTACHHQPLHSGPASEQVEYHMAAAVAAVDAVAAADTADTAAGGRVAAGAVAAAGWKGQTRP